MELDFNRFRYVLVTSTTYGNWLPGEERGFVGETDDGIHNLFGTPCDADLPQLKKYAENQMAAPPVFFNFKQAESILEQWKKESVKLT